MLNLIKEYGSPEGISNAVVTEIEELGVVTLADWNGECWNGCYRSTLSGYPAEEKQREIAMALGLKADFFKEDRISRRLEEMLAARGKIDDLKVEVAAGLMGMTRATLENGLKQGIFKWGYAIRMSEDGQRQWRYFINAKRFAEEERIEI